MSTLLTLELPEDAFSMLSVDPEHFGDEMRLAAAIKWYELGRISQGKAAAFAGLSRSAFIEALLEYGVSPIQTRVHEVESEYKQALKSSKDTDE